MWRIFIVRTQETNEYSLIPLYTKQFSDNLELLLKQSADKVRKQNEEETKEENTSTQKEKN